MQRRTGRFGRADRILFPREYRYVRQRGKRAASAFFVLWIAESGEGQRLGISVSKRVGKAVVRNRVKRGIREWFRSVRVEMRDGVDLVITARAGAAALTPARRAAELNEMLEEVGCLR